MKRRARPRIGITHGDKRRQTGWWLISLAVWLAGGRPYALTARHGIGHSFDGLVLGGGTDVHPGQYSGEIKPNYNYDPPRDALEIACLNRAEEAGLPVLGICRGAQLINVARGGTLCLDVAKVYEKADYPSGLFARLFYRKLIRVTQGSLLERLMQRRCCMVNSMHTQSVLGLGHELSITAMEENGVVQAIEDPRHRYLLGVQFHPEYLIYRTTFRHLFERLVTEAAAKRQTG